MDGQNPPNNGSQGISSSQPMAYQIKVQGILDSRWAEWFGGLTILLDEDGNTLLTGAVVDQAALYGLLRKVRDLGMPLLSVIFVENSRQDPPEVESER